MRVQFWPRIPSPSFCLTCIACASIIVLYGYLRGAIVPDRDDPLRYSLVNLPILRDMTDGWALSHFMFYSMLGFLYPDLFGTAMLVSISWELLEFALSRFTPGKVPLHEDTALVEKKADVHGDFWYAKPTDPLVNACAFLFGAHMRTDYREPAV